MHGAAKPENRIHLGHFVSTSCVCVFGTAQDAYAISTLLAWKGFGLVVSRFVDPRYDLIRILSPVEFKWRFRCSGFAASEI